MNLAQENKINAEDSPKERELCRSVMLILYGISLKKLREQEIMRAKYEAEEMGKLKSYFPSDISHEMRTHLTSILGFSEVF